MFSFLSRLDYMHALSEDRLRGNTWSLSSKKIYHGPIDTDGTVPQKLTVKSSLTLLSTKAKISIG